MSGMSRSVAQSPPPMTLPARTDAMHAPCLEEGTAVGRDHQLGAPLLLLYGSCPPIGSFSRYGHDPLAVLVAFVAGDADDGAHAFGTSRRLRGRWAVPMTFVA